MWGAFLCASWLFDRGCVLPTSVSHRRKDSTRGSNTALRIPAGSHGATRREEQIPPYRALRDSSSHPPMWGAFLCDSRLFDRGCVLPTSVFCRRKDSTRGSNTALRIPTGSHGASRREEQIPPYRALRDSSSHPYVGCLFMCPVAFRPRVRRTAFALLCAESAPAVRTLLFGSPVGSYGAPRHEEQIPPYRSAALAILKNK